MDSSTKITTMREGGHILAQIRDHLVEFAKVGMTFAEIEAEAQTQLKKHRVKPSFSTVPGYRWATCIMKNDGMCHGIPDKTIIADGDVVTIDVGLLHHGYHLDTTTTFIVGKTTPEKQRFLEVGRRSLNKAIQKVKAGQSVYEVSHAMQKVLQENGMGIVYQLTGHGVGERLHMEPNIPCTAVKADKKVILRAGQTIAVESMYTTGEPHLVLAADGWTYRTADGSLSGMFEETVLVTETGHEVLTK